ncbi:MAG: MMPL family transporter [Candidatus Limnocylindria bacterium]
MLVPMVIAAWILLRGDGTEPRGPLTPPGAPAPQPGLPPRDLRAHNGAFAALGRWTYRSRRWLPIVGLAAVIGLNAWAATSGGPLSQGGWQVPGSEAGRATDLLADRFGEQATTLFVLFTDPAGDAASAEFQQTVRDAVAPLADEPIVEEILTYAEVGDPSFLSRDGRRTFALLRLNQEVEAAVDDSEHLASLVDAPPDVDVIVTGIPLVQSEFNEVVEEDLVRAEIISLPIALLILLAVFGTLVGAALPIVIAGLALPTSLAVISLLANVTEMSIFVSNVTTMIGLALSIDYALFMVSRFREELRHATVAEAIERTMATVGKAVAISGIAVAIGLGSLIVFESPALRSMGIGGVVTVTSTLVIGLTVLPALLGMLGPRVNRLRVPLPRALRLQTEGDGRAAETGHGLWARIARIVMRRPLLIATPVLALLVLAGLPFAGIQLSTGGNLDDLPPTQAVEGFRILADEFPGGDADPVVVALQADQRIAEDGALSPEWITGLEGYTADLDALPGADEVVSVLDPPPGMEPEVYRQLLTVPASQRPPEAAGLEEYVERWVSDDVARVDIFGEWLPDSADGRALVDAVRAVPPPAGVSEVLTGGLPSRSRDFIASFVSSVPWAVAIVVAATGLVLFLTFGSVILPLKAVAMSLLSITASFGALVWIFQEGHFSDILAFDPSGTLVASTPILMFAVLFGLSMDYEVLLLSRIRERYVATGDNTRAVAEGIGITGGLITGAALVMVAVFGAFALSSVVLIKALGFSMALAVLIDATVVRGILVPAFMRVLGTLNWWAPRFVQRAVARMGLYEDGAEVARA